MAFYLAYGRDLDTGGYRDLEGDLAQIREEAIWKMAEPGAGIAIEIGHRIVGYIYTTKREEHIWMSTDKKVCRFINPETGVLLRTKVPAEYVAGMHRIAIADHMMIKSGKTVVLGATPKRKASKRKKPVSKRR